MEKSWDIAIKAGQTGHQTDHGNLSVKVDLVTPPISSMNV
jgi:hypothetical protein